MAIENKAAFYLKDFEIPEFNFLNTKGVEDENIEIGFDPKGEFSIKNKTFYLTLKFRLYDNTTSKDYFSTKIIGVFGFENVDKLEEIPSFFYKNSIAILYPYLRSFISSVTLQANIRNVILPTMNLSSLEPVLINASKEVD